MSAPLDELYLTWLYRQVGSVKSKNPSRTFWSLLRQLYTTEFVWLIPNDDNRVEDGRDLRFEFLHTQSPEPVDPEWMGLPCSVLEMLIALSRRLSFEAEGEPRDWFWRLIENLGLDIYNDGYYKYAPAKDEVEEIVNTFVWRRYHLDGRGGLFPLQHVTQDQRRVEIWQQLNAYLLERD